MANPKGVWKDCGRGACSGEKRVALPDDPTKQVLVRCKRHYTDGPNPYLADTNGRPPK